MKIRNGFVSNSSSCSFIVDSNIKTQFECIQEIKNILSLYFDSEQKEISFEEYFDIDNAKDYSEDYYFEDYFMENYYEATDKKEIDKNDFIITSRFEDNEYPDLVDMISNHLDIHYFRVT